MMNNPDLQSMTKKELIDLAELAFKFKAQQKGKRPEFLQRYVTDIVGKMPSKPTFKGLLDELELAAARRELRGEKASPIEKVDRVWELVTYHHPRKGRIQVSFETVRNKLSRTHKYI